MTEILQEYKINVKVKGYNLSLDITVAAKDPDDAFALACSQEFRYQDEDLYVLLVEAEDGDSVLCTYETLEEGMLHCETITSGKWFLVQKDEDGGIVLRSSEDNEESFYDEQD